MTYLQRLVVCTVLSVSGIAAAQGRSNPIELRINSASSFGGGLSIFGLVMSPGLTYDTEGENLIINIGVGAGYFLSPNLVLGGDLSISIFELGDDDDDDSLKTFGIVPYLKYVTGVQERKTGFFVEPSLGVSVVDFGNDSVTLLQLGVWGGGSFMFSGSSVALQIGPYVTYLRNTDVDEGDADNILVGVKFGLAAYLL